MINPLVIVTFLTASLMAGCSLDEPRLKTSMTEGGRSSGALITTSTGPLTPEQAQTLIRQLAPDEFHQRLLRELLPVQRTIANSPIAAGNDARILIDGPSTFSAMFDDIEKAKHHIHIETFIFDEEGLGKEVMDRLIERRRNGVVVRIIYDAFGSRSLSQKWVDTATKEGIELYNYHPLDPIKNPKLWQFDNRHHRKLMLVDGRIAYTGGINISSKYSDSSLSSSSTEESTDGAYRDTQVRLKGPVAHQFQREFIKIWKLKYPEAEFPSEGYFPAIESQGNMLAMALPSNDGETSEYGIYSLYIAALAHARRTAWITQAYFAPDDAFLETLRDTARRGVDTRLLVSRTTDAPYLVSAGRAYYESLLDAGVKIYERVGSQLHAKTMVVDGIWSTVGSSNLDYRSLTYNNEMNAIIVDSDFSSAMEKLYQADLQRADEITLEEWRDRPIFQKIKEKISKTFKKFF